MLEQNSISMEDFRALVTRAGMSLNTEELEHLKPMYEHFIAPVSRMHELDLEMEDLAVVFNPEVDSGQ